MNIEQLSRSITSLSENITASRNDSNIKSLNSSYVAAIAVKTNTNYIHVKTTHWNIF